MAADDRVAAKGHRSNGCVVSSTLSFDRNAMKRQCVSLAAPPFRDVLEAKEARASGEHTFQAFLREALPKTSKNQTCIGR
jgi:hypothetical protein